MQESVAKSVPKRNPNILLIGIGFGLFYWIIDAAIEILLFKGGSFWHSAFAPTSEQIWMRSFIMFLLILFSLVAQSIMNKRREAEKALEESEARYKRMASAAFEGIVIHDGKAIIDCNQAAAGMFGLKVEDIIGESPLQHIDDDSKQVVIDHIKAGYEKPYEVTAVRKDGNKFIMEINARKISYRGREVRVVALRDISNRKQTEVEHGENEKKYRMLFNNNNDPLFVFQVNANGDVGSFIEANDIACKLFDCTRETLMERSPDEFISPEEREAFKQIIQNLIDFKFSLFETEIINRGNRRIPIELSAHLFDLNGVRTIIASGRDLSERRKAEATLRDRESRYRKLFEKSPVIYTALEEDETIDEVSDRWLEMTGYDRQEVIGKPINHFLSEDCSKYFSKLFIKARTAQALHNIEITLIKKDGTPVTVMLDGNVERDDLGGFQKAHCIYTDISGLKQAKAGMAGYETGLRHLFDNVSEVIFTLDPQGDFLGANRQYEQVTGFARSEIIGKNIAEYVHPDDRKFTEQAFNKCGSGEEIPPLELRLRLKDGDTLTMEFVAAPMIRDGKTVAVQAISRPVQEAAVAERTQPQEVDRNYQDIIESMLDAVVMVDRDGKTILTNRALHKWTEKYDIPDINPGDRPVEMFDFLNEDSPQKFSRILETGDIEISDETYVINGQEKTFELHRIPVKSGDEVRAVIYVIRDIEERVKANREIEESAEKYRAIFEKSDGGFIHCAPDGRVTAINLKGCEILGLEEADVIDEPLEKVFGGFTDEAGDNSDGSGNSLLGAIENGRTVGNILLGQINRAGERSFWLNIDVATVESIDGGFDAYISFNDFTQWFEGKRLAEIQRDLGIALTKATGFEESIKVCTEAAIKAAQMDCGGIYIFDDENGILNLQYSTGLNKDFVRAVSRFTMDTEEARLVEAGEPFYTNYADFSGDSKKPAVKEGLRGIGVVPIIFEEKTIGCLNVASHSMEAVPDESRTAVETIGLQISGALVRAKAKKTLQDSELRFRQMAENIQEVFWMTNFDQSEKIYVSPAYKEIWGRDPEELYRNPKAWMNSVVEEDLDRVRKSQENIPEHEYEIEYRIKRPDGSIRWILDRAFPIRDDYGEVYRIVGAAKDISARKQIEEELRSERDLSESIIKTAQTIILVLDNEGKILNINPYGEELTGYALDEIIGKNWFDDYISEDTRKQSRNLFRATLDDIKITRAESKIVNRSGKELDIEWHNKSLKDTGGNVIGVLSIGQDITERKRAARVIEENEARYRGLFSNMSGGVAVFDWSVEKSDFVFRDLNRAGEEILRLRLTEISGRAFREVISDRGASGLYQLLERVMETGEPLRQPVSFKLEGQTKRWLENYIYPLQSGEIVLFFEDVTDRKLADIKLRYQADLLENVSDAIISTDLEFRIKSWNGAAERLYGMTPHEVLGKNIFEVIRTEFPEQDQEAVIEVLRSNGFWNGEKIQYDKKGNRHDMLVSASQLKDRDGKPRGYVAVNRDITKTKEAELMFHKSDQRFRAIFNSTAVGVVVIDKENNWLQVNDYFCNTFGYTKEEIDGITLYDMTHPDDKTLSGEKIAEIFSGKAENLQFEKRYIGKNGNIIWGSLSLSPIRDPEGNVEASLGVITDITILKEMQEELLTAKEFVDNLIDGLDDPIFVRDEELKWVTINKSGCELVGKSREKVIGKTNKEVFSKDRYKTADIRDKEVLESGTSRVDIDRITIDGKERVISVKRSPLVDVQTGKKYIIGFVHDITDIHLQAEKIRESEERLRMAVQNVPVMVDAFDDKMKVIVWNRECERVTGYSADEIIGNPEALEILYPDPEHRKEVFKYWSRGEHEDYRNWEQIIHCKDGSDKIISWSNVSGEHPVPGWYSWGVGVDITDRKLTEEALLESEERFRSIVESSVDGISLVDEAGMVIEWNSGQEKITGISREDAIGTPVWEIKHRLSPGTEGNEEKLAELREKTEELLGNPDAPFLNRFVDQEIVTAKGNTRIIQMLPFTIKSDLGFKVCTISRDITENKMLEKEHLKAQKLESIGILAGGIAHDFNNILTAIIGNITLAKMDVIPEHEIYGRLEEAEKASERAQDLTRQLLTFSKGGAPIKKSASIAQIVEESSSFALRGSKVKAKFDLAKDLKAVVVDPGQISQVINNLIINAVQAMPEGGKIKISAENVEIDSPDKIELGPGEYIKIVIKDNGLGIKADHLRKIFDPYFTTKQKGSGLGLATSYSIIKNHDGYIGVESKLGIGTAFTIYLPSSDEIPSEGTSSSAVNVRGGGRILVMDDEEAIRKITGITLKKLGYEIEFASDGTEAIESYRKSLEEGRKFDAVIMDLTIPGAMGGGEAIAELKNIDPEIKAIVSSGYSNDPIMADYTSYGFAGVVIKPYKATDLAAVVCDVLEGRKSDIPKS